MLLRLLTAMVLPSRSLAVLIGEPLPTISPSHASLSPVPASTPEATICRGSFFEAAMISDVVLEKPMSSSPATTAGTMAAPPAAILGSISSFSSLKKPCSMPT